MPSCTSLLAALTTSLLLLSSASALAIHQFEVYAPHVLAPNASSVWAVGDTQTVAWDTKSLDAQGMNTTGYLLLGYYTPGDTSGNEHLDIAHPLAHGFQLGAGSVDVVVPNVTTRDSYIVVLLGDSGDASTAFTINGYNLTDADATSSST